MDFIKTLQYNSGILNESKYGTKFDQFTGPFKVSGKEIKDNNGKEVCECKNADVAKELAAILTDIKQLRQLCEKIVSLKG